MKSPIAIALALCALAIAAPAAAAGNLQLAQAAEQKRAEKHRVVIQVSDPDPRIWAQALNYAENLQSAYGRDNLELEIVALGHGIGILKMDSPQAHRVPDTIKRGVKIQACEVTMSRQKLTRDDMLPGIGYVPGGLVRIIELQKQGWNYIKG